MAEEWTTKKVDKFVLVNKKLGTGAYGIVYRGFYGDDESKQVAVKTIPIKVSHYRKTLRSYPILLRCLNSSNVRLLSSRRSITQTS